MSVDAPISRAEHEEFRRAMEAEHKRQNKRIEQIENGVKEVGDTARAVETEQKRQNVRIEQIEAGVKNIGDVARAVERLATSVEPMVAKLNDHDTRLRTLEGRDGELWRKFLGYVISTGVGLLLGILSGGLVLK